MKISLRVVAAKGVPVVVACTALTTRESQEAFLARSYLKNTVTD
jgi:hypothetical protein